MKSQYRPTRCERGSIIQRMCLHQNAIWCAVIGAVHVYTSDCTKLREIQNNNIKCAIGLTLTNTGQLIVACGENKGLHLLESSGKYKSMIEGGYFSSVSFHNGHLYTLEYNKCAIVVFQLKNHKWKKVKEIPLRHRNGHGDDSLCVHQSGIYVMSCNNDCLYKYNGDGQLQFQAGQRGSGPAGQLKAPRVCGVDKDGRVLVADWGNNRLQVYDSQWHIVPIPGHLEKPIHAIIDPGNQDLWIATGDHTLQKYQVV